MKTFYLESSQFIDDRDAIIQGDDFHHLKHVLRIKTGDSIKVRSFTRREYHATVKEFKNRKVILSLKNHTILPPSPINIHLYLGIPKMPTLKQLIRQITELDITTLQLVEMEHSKLKTNHIKLEKLEKITREAMKQCLRPIPMEIPPPIKFSELNNLLTPISSDTQRFLAYELAEKSTKLDLGVNFQKPPLKSRISLFVGPEGGINLTEKKYLENQGFKIISLGTNILRTDTAVLFLIGKFI